MTKETYYVILLIVDKEAKMFLNNNILTYELFKQFYGDVYLYDNDFVELPDDTILNITFKDIDNFTVNEVILQ